MPWYPTVSPLARGCVSPLVGRAGGFKGLLDLYPGAATAYSLQRLASDSTNVVRVRRSSDNTEQDFTAAQITDGTLTTFCGAGNGFVRTWYDQSGNARHAQQATAGSQPQIVSSGTVLHKLAFNGGTMFMDAATIPNLPQPNEYYLTALDDDAAGFDLYFDSLNTGGGRNAIYTDTSGQLAYTAGTNQSSAQVTSGTWLATALFSGASSLLRYNGATVSTANPGAGQLNGGLSIGRSVTSSYINGSIKELIIYPSNQSANRAAIESQIASRYGITLA